MEKTYKCPLSKNDDDFIEDIRQNSRENIDETVDKSIILALEKGDCKDKTVIFRTFKNNSVDISIKIVFDKNENIHNDKGPAIIVYDGDPKNNIKIMNRYYNRGRLLNKNWL